VLVVPTSVDYNAIACSPGLALVIDDVVAILPRPVFTENLSIGLRVSTLLWSVMPPSALV